MTKNELIREIRKQGQLHLHAQAAGPRGAKRWVVVVIPQHDRICRHPERCLVLPSKKLGQGETMIERSRY